MEILLSAVPSLALKVKLSAGGNVTDQAGRLTIGFTSTAAEMKIIMAKVNNELLETSAIVVFVAGEVDAINIESEKAEMDVEEKMDLTATVTDKYGNLVDEDEVEFQPSAGQLGPVRKVGVGTFTFSYTSPSEPAEVVINAQAGDKTVALPVSVKYQTFEITPQKAVVKEGTSIQFSIQTQQQVKWEVLGDIGQIDANGLFSANQAGAGQILASLAADESVKAQTELITVEARPSFTITSFKSQATITTGDKLAMYLIRLQASADFTAEVTLYTVGLPTGIEAEFNPGILKLTSADSGADAQMTLLFNDKVKPGDYAFTVLALSSDISQSLPLTLTVESAARIETSLFLILPKEAEFKGRLDISGQLLILEETSVELDQLSVQIKLTSPGSSIKTLETPLNLQGNYQIATSNELDQIGRWTVSAEFAGDVQLAPSFRRQTVEVTPALAELVFLSPESAELGESYTLLGSLDPPLASEFLRVKILDPNSRVSMATMQTDSDGGFSYSLELEEAGDWTATLTWEGNSDYQPVTRTFELNAVKRFGKVIVVMAGVSPAKVSEWRKFNSVAERVYQTFKRRSFNEEEDIYFLSPDPNLTEGADAETTIKTLQYAITKWAASAVNANIPLYLYLLSHNIRDKFLLDSNQQSFLTPGQLDIWLDELPEGTPTILIIEACYSGNFISRDGQPSLLLADNRTIITSARQDRQAKIMRSSSFSRIFFEKIKANKTIKEAFLSTESWMSKNFAHRDQYPQIEVNGNGVSNEAFDFRALGDRRIPADISSLSLPPAFISQLSAIQLEPGHRRHQVDVELTGVEIERVFASIAQPGFDPGQEFEDWSELDSLIIEKDLELIETRDQVHRYRLDYDEFTQSGEYALVFQAGNLDGSAVPIQTTVTVKKQLAGDVNGDSQVDLFDLVQVASMFGKKGEGLAADISGDGQVDLFDLVQVAGNFGKSEVAAPRVLANKLTFTAWQKRSIQLAIVELEEVPVRSEKEELIFNLLKAILPERLPGQTQLLPNYPNPFNPETWIPFELSQDSEVSLTIYDAVGHLIRQLDLGFQPAGAYLQRNRAISWDGRTQSGEQVASGTYFYTLKTEDCAFTQKMIILK